MKYIRTPIGIYDLENSVFYDFDGLCKYHISHCEYYENNPDECRVSNSLEKLCDEFVFDSNLTKYVIKKEYVEHCKKNTLEILTDDDHLDLRQHNPKIYGAIWTDKGLIYVAKMNDDGELVLI